VSAPRLGRYAVVAVVVALVGYVGFALDRHTHLPGRPGGGPPAATRVPIPHATEAAVPYPPDAKVFLGLNTSQGPYDFGPVDAFTAATGYQPSVLQFAVGWAVHTFDRSVFDRVADRGMFPVMSWEPWNYQESGPDAGHGAQPIYRLSRITDGAFDDYIRSYAEGIKTLGYQVGIRFAHEMNGFWYPWCEQSNGNRPGDYVRAWRHVHDIFTAAGATNVVWIWSPNVSYPGSTPLRELYPGDQYVDWVGLSGYYGTGGMESYRSFDNIFDKTIDELQAFTSKPIVVTETGATDSAGRKAEYVTQMFADLPHHPEIIGVIWFEAVKELDWRIAVSPAASAAYRAGAAEPRYQVTWSPSSIARTGPPA
jgi:hypothetical protein